MGLVLRWDVFANSDYGSKSYYLEFYLWDVPDVCSLLQTETLCTLPHHALCLPGPVWITSGIKPPGPVCELPQPDWAPLRVMYCTQPLSPSFQKLLSLCPFKLEVVAVHFAIS